MSTIPTPRTDAVMAYDDVHNWANMPDEAALDTEDFARKLERELTVEKQKSAKLEQDAKQLAKLLDESVNHPRIKSAPLADVSDEWRERIYKALREHEALL